MGATTMDGIVGFCGETGCLPALVWDPLPSKLDRMNSIPAQASFKDVSAQFETIQDPHAMVFPDNSESIGESMLAARQFGAAAGNAPYMGFYWSGRYGKATAKIFFGNAVSIVSDLDVIGDNVAVAAFNVEEFASSGRGKFNFNIKSFSLTPDGQVKPKLTVDYQSYTPSGEPTFDAQFDTGTPTVNFPPEICSALDEHFEAGGASGTVAINLTSKTGLTTLEVPVSKATWQQKVLFGCSGPVLGLSLLNWYSYVLVDFKEGEAHFYPRKDAMNEEQLIFDVDQIKQESLDMADKANKKK